MKKTHYTIGYGGKLNYHTICGKEIHSHDKKESATIDPKNVNCKSCQNTKTWKEDYEDCIKTKSGIRRRIYLESDVLHADELIRAQDEVASICDEQGIKYVRRVFSEVLDYAWHDLNKTWEAVKKADEIYSDSSLMPLIGGSYTGAPAIFNGMCERAIKENVSGKDVYILNGLKNIYWGMINIPIMKKAFKSNNLFIYNEKREMVKINISKIKSK